MPGDEPQPFHVVPPAAGAAPADRRLLLISEHFPPRHSVGSLRWQKLSRYLAERGWGLDVVTLHPDPQVAGVDMRRLADLPPDVRVYTVPQRMPVVGRVVSGAWHGFLRRLLRRDTTRAAGAGGGGVGGGNGKARAAANGGGSRIAGRSFAREEVTGLPRRRQDLVRAYSAWIDYARSGLWAEGAAALGARIVGAARGGVHRAVVSSGPPHMAHEGARLVARRCGLPLVVDFRDPWSLVQRIPEAIASPLWYRLAERYERGVLADAALVVCNTEVAARALRARYPSAAPRIVTVMNGADDDDAIPARSDNGGPFVVAYAGTIYLDRDPGPLFAAAGQVVRELGLAPSQFAIRFMGDDGGYDVPGAAAETGLQGFVSIVPPRPRADALRFLADATLLVSLPQDSTMAIPAKVFEYLQFDAWVLALAEPESATELALRGSGADVVAPHDRNGIAAVLRTRYEEYARGVRPRAINCTGRFSRRAQADVLLSALERITGSAAEESACASVPSGD